MFFQFEICVSQLLKIHVFQVYLLENIENQFWNRRFSGKSRKTFRKMLTMFGFCLRQVLMMFGLLLRKLKLAKRCRKYY